MKALFLFGTLLMATFVWSQNIDRSFRPEIGSEIPFEDFEVQEDGKIIIASGKLIRIAGTSVKGVARLNSDGSLDHTFEIGTYLGERALVHDIILQDDGKILIAGQSLFPEYPDRQLLRFNPDGTLDTSFDYTYPTSVVLQGAVTAEGKILLSVFPEDRNDSNFIRINSDGSLDNSFAAVQMSASVGRMSIKLTDEGEILVVGDFNQYNDISIDGVVKLTADGQLDTSFDPSQFANQFFYGSVDLQSDEKLIISGSDLVNGKLEATLARLNQDGTLDASFTFDESLLDLFPFGIYETCVLPDDKILVANGDYVVRLTKDGAIDDSFSVGNLAYGFSDYFTYNQLVTIKAKSNTAIVCGRFNAYNDESRFGLAFVDQSGILAATDADLLGRPKINAVEVTPDGDIIVGGEFLKVEGLSISNLVRFNPDGTVDELFMGDSEGANREVFDVSLDNTTDAILVGGEFSNVANSFTGASASLNDVGSRLETFNPVANQIFGGEGVSKIEAHGDNVYLGGLFEASNIRHFVRYNRSDNTLLFDDSFNSTDYFDTPDFLSISDIDIQSDGKIIVSGLRNSTSGLETIFTRFDVNGNIDESFSPPDLTNTEVRVVHVLENDELLFGGFFTNSYSNNDFAPIFHTSKDGALIDNAIGTQEGSINTILQLNNEEFIVAGDFDVISSKQLNSLAKISFDNVLEGFDIGLKSASRINDIKLLDETSMIVVGDFSQIRQEHGLGSIVKVSLTNDTPELLGTNQTLETVEDSLLFIDINELIVEDDTQFPLDFTMQIQDGTSYNVSENTVIPIANFSGTLTVPLTVFDGNAFSNSFAMEIEVTPVNDPPAITLNQSFQLTEPGQLASVTIDVTDPDGSTDFTAWEIVSGNEDNVFSIDNTTGTLSFNQEVDFSSTTTYSLGFTVSDGQLVSEVGVVQIITTKPLTVTEDAQAIIYPNPVSDQLYVKSSVAVDHLIITDLTGKVVKKFAGNDQFLIGGLEKGIYLCIVHTKNSEPLKTKFLVD